MPNRILVTGAAGFVGSHLLPALAAAFPDSAIVPGTFDVMDQAAMLVAIAAIPRLERGRFVWPQAKDGVVSRTPAQLSMLTEGIDWRMPAQSWQPEMVG